MKTQNMTDWDALRAVAALVRAGSAVPADLQLLANEAMVRALAAGKLPPRKRGRPSSDGRTPNKTLRVALAVHCLVDSGVPLARAVEAIAEAIPADPSTVYRYANDAVGDAQLLIKAADPNFYALDLIAPYEEIRAVEEAQQRAFLFKNTSRAKN